ncbi:MULTISPECIES: branched-chain amino acid aminotransferase [Trueperella]|uniref:branched-chain-amino-acid transaminase n=1 Tax=Trueperella abortisuis TaxID=445930 RepID=A0ABT9PJJ1_9ACTO|nr:MULTISPECIES: branched-chain amino acid aminotransferase [Trueperella]MDP9832872.1 branched-chain amino acid aminotransferase [Trueperella abortisuis]MDY5402863.1 branched-chain amino acid aminotransferase [Trueperella sp.]
MRQHTELEKLSAQPVASADSFAGTFALQRNEALKSEAEYEQVMDHLGFGTDFSDYMARATWSAQKGWHNKGIVPYGPLSLDPAGAILHYGQEAFEGMKAYRHDDGSIWTFRPTYNAARINMSCRRLAIPEIPLADFMGSIVDLVRADARWVPSAPGSSLYLRPFVFASEAFLGVRAATRYEYLVIASPSGAYFPNGLKPINVFVDRDYHRAGPGGMGDVKTGGNYAASLLPKVTAHDAGYDEVLFLDAATNTNIDELGGMNVFIVMADGSVKTPKLTGNILPGGTRSSILDFLESEGVAVSEETISLASVVNGIESGEVAEMFACGTAAVVTPIGRLASTDFDVEVPVGEKTAAIYDELTAIQLGHREDRFGWLYKIADA